MSVPSARHGAKSTHPRSPGTLLRRATAIAALAAAFGALATSPARAEAFDRAGWAQWLQTHTRRVDDMAGTRVDYASLKKDPGWRAFVDSLAQARPPRGRGPRMAFWIDVYNVLAIDTVVRHWPVDSIKDAGSFFRPVWGMDAGTVGGRVVTLHEIEHEILRPMGDPRIHMAIVCASTSCPSLAREPFDPARLDAQLDAAVRRFLADPRKGMSIDRMSGTLTLSRIFDWFDEDFDDEDGVRGFLSSHIEHMESIPSADFGWLCCTRSKIRIRYLDYDWRVNAVER